MGSVVGLEWLFSSTTTFLFFCIFIMTIGTFAATKQVRASLKVAVLTLVYASYSGNDYLTGILYVVVILIALLLSNQMFGLLFGSGEAEEI